MSLCSYGYNYQRLSKSIVIGGIVVREFPISSQARKKKLREHNKVLISVENITQLIDSLNRDYKTAEADIQDEKETIIASYIESEQFKADFLERLRPQIVEGLSFVHDYKQINAEISQNINVIIEEKYKADSFDDKVELSTPEEMAIYKASKILEEKLNVVRLLLTPDLINRIYEYKKCKLHGLITKYLSIYSTHIKRKGIKARFTGTSYNEIFAHPDAISVIPHTFIDNAVKYSTKGSSIDIHIEDQPTSIYLSVTSYGPRILPEEKLKIFQAFYRGEAAKKQEEEGAGYGLYISQYVAQEHLGTKITFNQEQQQKPHFGHKTTFSVNLPLNAKLV